MHHDLLTLNARLGVVTCVLGSGRFVSLIAAWGDVAGASTASGVNRGPSVKGSDLVRDSCCGNATVHGGGGLAGGDLVRDACGVPDGGNA